MRIGAFIDDTTVPRYVESYTKLTRLQILQYERRQRRGQIQERMQGDRPNIRSVAARSKALETGISELRKSEAKNARRAGVIGKGADEAEL